MIYIIIGLFFCFSIVIFETGRKNKNGANFIYWVQCLVLIALAGLRNYVGGDTIGYMMMWDDLPTFSELENFNFLFVPYQPLWYYINALAKYIYDDFTTFQIIHATIINLLVFLFIKKFSVYRFSAVLGYYLITYIYFNCEILRESLAICVFLLAIPSLIEKKWLVYYTLCLVAFLFHTSAIILFFLPFVRNTYVNVISFKTIMYFVGIVAIISNQIVVNFIVSTVFPFLKPLVDTYSESEWEWSPIGLFVAVVKCFMLGLLIFERQKSKTYSVAIDGGLKMYLFFSLFALFIPIAQRFQNYFVIFFIISFAEFFWESKGVSMILKNIIILFFIITIFQYYLKDVSEFSGVESRFIDRFYPYYSVYEDIPSKDLELRKSIYLIEGQQQ